MTVRLRTVTGTRPATAALKAGDVAPAGFALDFVEVDPLPRAFRAMVRELAFDVCEMAFVTYLCAREHGVPITALPLFVVRDFHHAAIVVAAGANVAPSQLEGARVGVNRGYTVTGGVWARGVLASEHGVDLSRVTWVPTDAEHVAECRPPENVEPPALGEDVAALTAAGALRAAVGVRATTSELVPLIADPQEAAFAALRERGHYPINHLLVVRDELLARHPELAGALFRAYAESKRVYLDAGELSEQHRRIAEIVGGDPLPYGIEPNRGAIEELLDHTLAQRILRERPRPSELFAPATEDMVG